MTGLLLVGLGAAVGAPARYLLDGAIQSRHQGPMPWGTIVVNLLGAFALGVLVGSAAGDDALLLLGTGFCGTFTTYSTFAYEAVRLLEERQHRPMIWTLAVTTFGGLAAAALGYVLVG